MDPVLISKILQEAWAGGLQLKLRGAKLTVTGPPSVMTIELAARIRDNKQAIIERLENIDRVLRESSQSRKPSEPPSAGCAGLWDHKATVSGGIPPAQRVAAEQAWLRTIDWNKGLRCGRTGQQCTRCTGMPCHDSTEWTEPNSAA